jgi:hypothetical protein
MASGVEVVFQSPRGPRWRRRRKAGGLKAARWMLLHVLPYGNTRTRPAHTTGLLVLGS